MVKKINIIPFFSALTKYPLKMQQMLGYSEETATVRIPLKNKIIYIISNPADIKHIFYEQGPNYIRDSFLLSSSRDIMEGGLAISNERLTQDGKAMMRLFADDKNHTYVDSLTKAYAETLDTWDRFVKSDKPFILELELTIVLIKAYQEFMLGGVQIDNAPDVANLINDIFFHALIPSYYLKHLGKIPLIPFVEKHRNYLKCKAKATDVGKQILARSFSTEITRFNLLKYLAHEFGYPDNLEMMDNYMKQHLAGRGFGTLVSATHNMVGVLGNLLVMMSSQPGIAAKIREEVQTVLGDRIPTYEDYKKLNYTRGAFLETLRLYPMLFYTFRTCLQDDKLSNVTIRKGDFIVVPALVTHKFPQYWDNPEGFAPERFMQKLTPEQQLLYFGFTHGPQSCIAKEFSCIQATLLIAMLAQRYRLDLIPGVSREYDPKFLYVAYRLNPDFTMKVNRIS